MTTGRDKCGLSSLLPMSCRGRAEAFARHLHSRLKSLGSEDENGVADENSWLAAHENPVTFSQPRHNSDGSDPEIYLDFGNLESPGSPKSEEELLSEEYINDDALLHDADRTKKPVCCSATSHDSDSDGPFYDSEDINRQQFNGVARCAAIAQIDESNDEEVCVSYSDCNLSQRCSSFSDDLSTFSARDEDCFSECSSCLPEELQTEAEAERRLTEVKEDSCQTEELTAEVDEDDEERIRTLSEGRTEPKIRVEDDEDNEERIPRVRRCSSLRTGKTPPGTPGRKKIVRFADVLGLDLADVRTYLDEIPKVPNSAYDDLKDCDFLTSTSDSNLKFPEMKVEKILVPLFQQPGGRPDFLDRVREHQVCLDSVLVEDPVALSIGGIVRVKNLDFNKSVHVRYTLDSWQSFADVQAGYVENSCDGFSDKFSFLIFAHSLSVGRRLEFAIRFQCKGCQYWDSNDGENYCFQCLPATSTSPAASIVGGDDIWAPSFYY